MKKISLALASIVISTGALAQSAVTYVSDEFRERCNALSAQPVTFKAGLDEGHSAGEAGVEIDPLKTKWRLHSLQDPATNAICSKLEAEVLVRGFGSINEATFQKVVAAMQTSAAQELKDAVWFGNHRLIRQGMARDIQKWEAPAKQLYSELSAIR